MNEPNYNIEQDGNTPETTEAKRRRFFRDLAGQFAALPMAIFTDVRDKRLKHRDVCLYMHLLVKQGTNQSSYWGIDSLALLTGANKTSVKESLRRLAACGHIARRRGKNTSHTVCLTKLLPGRGIDGIRVKGKEGGANEQEASGLSSKASPCQPQVKVLPKPAKVQSASGLSYSEEGDADAVEGEAFYKEWDESVASAEAEDRSRQWSAIQSRKY